jgi:hypothetical protein
MYRFINANGAELLVQRANEAKDVAAFLERQPRVLPQAPTKPRPSLGLLVFRLLLLFLVAFAMATAFLLFGEEPPEQVVRPLLTAQQRAQAFRL